MISCIKKRQRVIYFNYLQQNIFENDISILIYKFYFMRTLLISFAIFIVTILQIQCNMKPSHIKHQITLDNIHKKIKSVVSQLNNINNKSTSNDFKTNEQNINLILDVNTNTKNKISVNITNSLCKKLIFHQKKVILANIESILQQLQQIHSKNNIKTTFKRLAFKYLSFIKNLKRFIKSKCQHPPVHLNKKQFFQTNLFSNNWILGNQSFDDLIEFYYNNSIQQDKIYNCPLSSPFYNNFTCIQCANNSPIFNLQSLKCQNCKSDQFYSQATRSCINKKICKDEFFNQQNNTCQNYKNCTKNLFLNKTTNLCQQKVNCTQNMFYNETINKCQNFTNCSVSNQYLQVTTNKCIDFVECGDKFLNKNINKCVNKSICNQSEFYNKTSNNCTQFVNCTNKFLNKSSNNCEQIPICENQYYLNQSNKCINYTECNNTFLNKSNNKCQQYKKCESKYLNKTNNQCQQLKICNKTEWYNNQTNLCQPLKNCSNQFLNKTTNKCQPIKTCNDSFYVNQTNQCISYKNCTYGTELNKTDNTCIQCQKKYYNNQTKKCEQYKICSGDTPFLNKSINNCSAYVQCTNKFLNKTLNMCQQLKKCNEYEFYNQTNNDCQPYKKCPQFLNKKTNLCERYTICKHNLYLNKSSNDCILQSKCSLTSFLDKINKQCIPFVQCGDKYLNKIKNECQDYLKCEPNKTQLLKQNNTCIPIQVICKNDQILNKNTGVCTPLPKIFLFYNTSNIINGKLTLQNYQKQILAQETFNPNAIIQNCPFDKPFTLISSCVACNATHPYFFLDTFHCTNCSGEFQYSPQKKQCLKIFYLTNNKATNINLVGNTILTFNDYQINLSKNNTNAIIKTCPLITPFSIKGDKCISCPFQNTYFNVVTLKCSGCDTDQTYNAQSHSCE